MRRPAPISVEEIRHPGPKSPDRRPVAFCHATPVTLDVPKDQPVLKTLAAFADAQDFNSAVLDFETLNLKPFEYVMPDRAVDDRHVAWYSDTKMSSGAALDESVAILGWKEGNWFAHVHAFWIERGKDHLGHLLPHTLEAAEPCQIKGWGLRGAAFIAAEDPETEFTLFRVKEKTGNSIEHEPNALITTLAPFEDLYKSISDLASALGTEEFRVHGLGSLAGADFHSGDRMSGLISEILLHPDAGRKKGEELRLPIRAVDLHGHLFQGDIVAGSAPTLVTCELLVTTQIHEK